MSKTISILGCGWYGTALARALVNEDFKVKASTTSADKIASLQSTGAIGYIVNLGAESSASDSDFFQCDVLIISIPPKRHAGEHNEYPKKIRAVAEIAQEAGVKSLIMISSTSVYGDSNKEVQESDPLNPDTDSGRAIEEAENIIKSYTSFKTTVLRFGGLIGPGRNLGRFFAGKTNIPNGLAPVNLLHLEDCIALTMHVINSEAFGYTFNCCSPDHPSRKDLYTLVAERSGLEKPEFVDQLTKWKQIDGNLITSTTKYKYLVNNWSDFLTADKL